MMVAITITLYFVLPPAMDLEDEKIDNYTISIYKRESGEIIDSYKIVHASYKCTINTKLHGKKHVWAIDVEAGTKDYTDEYVINNPEYYYIHLHEKDEALTAERPVRFPIFISMHPKNVYIYSCLLLSKINKLGLPEYVTIRGDHDTITANLLAYSYDAEANGFRCGVDGFY